MGVLPFDLGAVLAGLTPPFLPALGLPAVDPGSAAGAGQFTSGSALGSLALPVGSGVLSAAPLLLSQLGAGS